MPKRKSYTAFLSAEDRIDVDLEFTKDPGKPGRIVRFAITYSAWLRDRWREVIRYDNFHGSLHRQRFWRSEEPEPMAPEERLPLDQLVARVRDDLRKNWRRYRSLMEDRVRSE